MQTIGEFGSASKVDLGRFTTSRTHVVVALGHLREIALELHASASADLLDEAARRLLEDRFRLVVAGEFNNGKSTLINALLGEQALPSSSSPSTAVLSVIRYGETPCYRICRQDGSVEETTKESFRILVAPHEPDPRDELDKARFQRETEAILAIDHVEIDYPTPLCAAGVEIVDTPGTNDPNAARERITYEFIPNADAVVFVLSARMPLDQSEMDFLRDRILASDIGRLFFVVNFRDFLDTPEKQRKVLAYVQRHLSEIIARPRIFLVCARDAILHRSGGKSMRPLMAIEETGLIELERALSVFLTNERAATKLARPISVGERIGKELVNDSLRIRRASIGLTAAKLSEGIAELQPHLAAARRDHAEVLSGLRSRLADEGAKMEDELRSGLEKVVREGVFALDGYKGELTRESISKAVETAIAKKHTDLIEQVRQRQANALRAQCAMAQKRINSSWEAVRLKVDAEFGCVGSEDVDLSDLATNDPTGVAVAGGLGTMALVAFAHIAFPIALIAGVMSFFGIGMFSEDAQRKKAIGKLRPKIQEKLSEGVPTTVSAFVEEWNRASAAACGAFDSAFIARIGALEGQLASLLLDRSRSLDHDNDERLACDRIEDRIMRQVGLLRELRWQ